ncbi:ImmA/IrrE family metallo-endopeptidase [Senegalia massiliensis]|uniref:ImmA/IrrE family metallo-endopeptidase n=1 Tax=Senegalia massiliensis TaxID=1720316 RepID=A0A845QWA5_9CLOT|nr:ImmA/IrrE family metallo-endopeptidase [Senegalia massiliensis]NBI05796.1 ImmA/IrrE family metallo-endopeptidase [Senegalia massiliensis]
MKNLDNKLKKPPINPLSIIETMDNCKYKLDDLCGEEGYTLYRADKNFYLICINDTLYKPRMSFTTAHEIGHVVLGHFRDYKNKELSEEEEQILDKEADVFAGEILMPENQIHSCNLNNIHELKDYFKVSKEAMEVRLKFLNYDSILDNTKLNKSQLKMKSKLILLNEIKNTVKKFHNKTKEEKTMADQIIEQYKGYPVDKDKQLYNCPKCEFYDISKDDNYCPICGTYLYNKCENQDCSKIQEGYARFCTSCGSSTYLYKNGFLNKYKNDSYIDDEDLPF